MQYNCHYCLLYFYYIIIIIFLYHFKEQIVGADAYFNIHIIK